MYIYIYIYSALAASKSEGSARESRLPGSRPSLTSNPLSDILLLLLLLLLLLMIIITIIPTTVIIMIMHVYIYIYIYILKAPEAGFELLRRLTARGRAARNPEYLGGILPIQVHPVLIPRIRCPRFVPRVGLPRNLFR